MSIPLPSPPDAPVVLLVFPWCLDRIGHGNVQRVLAMADYLSAHGVILDLVYQGNPRVPSREHLLTGFRRVIRVAGWESTDDDRFHEAWETFYDGHESPSWNLYPGTALAAMVRSLVDAVEYTALISSYAWTAPIFHELSSQVLRIVDLHDILSLHSSRCETVTGALTPFSIVQPTEELLWRQWDVLLAITREEADIISPTLFPSQELLTVPHHVPLDVNESREPAAGDRVVYTGSDNHSNQAAVTWLLTEVWPQVLAARPHAVLRLVGLVCQPLQQTPLVSVPNVEWVGFVDRPADELANAAVCVAPYLYGSGLKIKVIEGAGAGCPLVTTRAGAEGSGLVNGTQALIEDDASAYAAAIVRLLDDRALGRRLASAARDHVRRTFSDEACYGALLEVLRRPARAAADPLRLASAVVTRLRKALAVLGGPPVVVWGNGSHTRMLMEVLKQANATVRCIVDKGAATDAVSPEHCPVVPGRAFTPRPDDLIVLSSQIYEPDMWNDLATTRAAGIHVLALYRRELTTVALRPGLATKRAHAASPPAVVSAAAPAR